MPLTVAHAAAAAVLARTPLVTSAVVVGTVVPDLPYYLPLPVDSAVTHGPLGVVGVDLVLGMAGFALLHWVLRAPLVDVAPAPLRHRLSPRPPALPGPVSVVVTALSVVAGAATHVLWDSFTQANGAAVVAWPVLGSGVVGPHRLFNVLMYASSAGGLLVLAWWALRWYRRTPPTAVCGPARFTDAARWWLWAGLAGCATVGAVLSASAPQAAASGYDLVRAVLLGLGQGLGVWVGGAVVAWHLVRVRRAAGAGGVPAAADTDGRE